MISYRLLANLCRRYLGSHMIITPFAFHLFKRERATYYEADTLQENIPQAGLVSRLLNGQDNVVANLCPSNGN